MGLRVLRRKDGGTRKVSYAVRSLPLLLIAKSFVIGIRQCYGADVLLPVVPCVPLPVVVGPLLLPTARQQLRVSELLVLTFYLVVVFALGELLHVATVGEGPLELKHQLQLSSQLIHYRLEIVELN